ncbi:MAG: hypothetical protein GY928_04150 [Colwellia sp.]|nr:hypothetical protein [Colwellia sp.]
MQGSENNITKKNLTCFTIMPSGTNNEYNGGADESDFVYKSIVEEGVSRASKKLNININNTRQVDKNMSGSITKAIIKSLSRSDFVIADITGRNPNVFLELGIRYTLCSINTILLNQTSEMEKIPFDIGNYKVIPYHRFHPNDAATALAEHIESAYKAPDIDSPVFDAIDDLEVFGKSIKKLDISESKSATTMAWHEIMNRLESLSFYEEHYRSGTFKPDALIGITNGGLIMAEIISRRYFLRLPLIALWANRWSDEPLKDATKHYFSNEWAQAAIHPLKTMLSQRKTPLTLLVIDDNVASGITCQYAVRFLREELGEDTNIVFHPIVCKNASYLSSIKEVLPTDFNNNLFKLSEEEFNKQLLTDKSRFPYDKDIRG